MLSRRSAQQSLPDRENPGDNCVLAQNLSSSQILYHTFERSGRVTAGKEPQRASSFEEAHVAADDLVDLAMQDVAGLHLANTRAGAAHDDVARPRAVPGSIRMCLRAARIRSISARASRLMPTSEALVRMAAVHPEPTLGAGTKRQISSTSDVHFPTDASPVAARKARGGRRAILPRCPRENGWRTGKCLTPTDISGRVSNRCLSDCVLSPYFPPGGRLSIQKGDHRRDARE
jgi:hypothetical protein